MVGSLVMLTSNSYHVRSISMHPISHPATLSVQEKLNKLRDWGTSSSTIHPTGEILCDGLIKLSDIYECIDGFLHLPLTQQSLYHQYERCVDEVLDESIRLLDMCGATRDILSTMKESVQDLQSALRRRGGELSIQDKVHAYNCSRKKAKKAIAKCLIVLKRMSNKFSFSSLLDKETHLVTDITVMREVMSITISIFSSLLSFISAVRSPKPKTARWALVSKWMHVGRVACSEEMENMSEVETVDADLYALYGSPKNVDCLQVQSTQNQLDSLETRIECLEDGLEYIFRCMIKTRVSLLNLLSH